MAGALVAFMARFWRVYGRGRWYGDRVGVACAPSVLALCLLLCARCPSRDLVKLSRDCRRVADPL